MTREEVHKGDIGTKFLVTINEDDLPVDISTASVKKIITKDPDGTIVEHDAAFETDGSDGKIYWITTLITDLAVTGEWEIEARIEMGGGTWSSSIDTFQVFKIIE